MKISALVVLAACLVVTYQAMAQVVNVRDFGAVGDGITNDSAAVEKAAAAISSSGGILYFPTGKYYLPVGSYNPYSAFKFTMKDSMTIKGDGKGITLIIGHQTVFGIMSDWAIFKFNNSNKHITIEGISFYQGMPACFTGVDGVTVKDCYINGYIAPDVLNVYGVSFWGCSNVRVLNCDFFDGYFPVYFGNTGSTRTSNALVQGCTFENKHYCNSISDNPVGVYLYYADRVQIIDNSFKNIWPKYALNDYPISYRISSGVYIGDGENSDISVIGNAFDFSDTTMGKSVDTAKSAYLVYGQGITGAFIVADNVFKGFSGSYVGGIIYTANSTAHVKPCLADWHDNQFTSCWRPVYTRARLPLAESAGFNIHHNTAFDSQIAVALFAPSNSTYQTVVNIADNIIDSTLYGIICEGADTAKASNVQVINNEVLRAVVPYRWLEYQPDKQGTAVEERMHDVPSDFLLFQNYPNPFNPSTVIDYSLPMSISVTLKLYDSLGRELATLVNERQSAGRHSVTVNANGLSSGVYYYRLQADGFQQTKEMRVIK
jgi:hypothetical protein